MQALDLTPQRSHYTFLMHILYIRSRHILLCLFDITIVRGAECHALSTPLFPEGEESGLRDLSYNGGEMLFVAWRGGLTVSVRTVAAINHRLTLGKQKHSFNWLTVMPWENIKGIIHCSVTGIVQKNYLFSSYIAVLLGESIDRW